MQKLVYLSNSRDYAEEGDINQNKYFPHINELLGQGWKVAHVTHDVVETDDKLHPSYKETLVAFVLLEKPEESRELCLVSFIWMAHAGAGVMMSAPFYAVLKFSAKRELGVICHASLCR